MANKEYTLQQEYIFYFYKKCEENGLFVSKCIRPEEIMFTDSLSLTVQEGVYTRWEDPKVLAKLIEGKWELRVWYQGKQIAQKTVPTRKVIPTVIELLRLQVLEARKYCEEKEGRFIIRHLLVRRD